MHIVRACQAEASSETSKTWSSIQKYKIIYCYILQMLLNDLNLSLQYFIQLNSLWFSNKADNEMRSKYRNSVVK